MGVGRHLGRMARGESLKKYPFLQAVESFEDEFRVGEVWKNCVGAVRGERCVCVETPGADGDRARAEKFGAGDVVRRVADDDELRGAQTEFESSVDACGGASEDVKTLRRLNRCWRKLTRGGRAHPP